VMKFYHAHKVDVDLCRGHMTCMRVCPTQAIRVRNRKAVISPELCVDCGMCISVCRPKAIVPITDNVAVISRFKHKVVVPSPVLYSQFEPDIHPYIVHMALKEVGFDQVIDVSTSSTALAKALVKYMRVYEGQLPLISSHCPSLVRLVQVRFPDLVDQVLPLDVPREITAREIRRTLPKELGLKPEDIGIFYIAPCPAKIVSINQPAEKARSWFDGAISMSDVYSILLPHVVAAKEKFDTRRVPSEFVFDPGWSMLGSLTMANGVKNWLAVSGVDHVTRILNDIESGRLRNIDFVEAMTCMLGCVGGPFCVENPYVARANSMKQSLEYQKRIEVDEADVTSRFEEGYFNLEHPVLPRPTTYFDTDLETSIKRMKEKERVYKKLPQIDCGCCGAPTCMAFAEDFVLGNAELTDCVFFVEKTEVANTRADEPR
jgi:iron only hydrogenase large subunit-like protein